MKNNQVGTGETKLETAISYLLIIGVITSLVLEVTGIIMLYVDYHQLPLSQDPIFYIRGINFFTFIYDQFLGDTGEPLSIRMLTLGIAVLMLTPFLRVMVSAVYFALRKNLKYTLITVFVLAILTVSLVLH
jgi:uncharacterized membrane protein